MMRKLNSTVIFMLTAILLIACSKESEKTAVKAKPINPQDKTEVKNMGDLNDTLAILETSYGRVVIDLFEDATPLHANNFKNLMSTGVLKGTYFHRIIPNFVVQGGDPNTLNGDRKDDGTGGVGERIPAEIGKPHLRGSLGAARDNNPTKASSGSQFYFCLKPLPQLDGNYTVFGTVVEGMNNVDLMAQVARDPQDNPIEPVYITNTTLMSKSDFDQMKADAK